MDNRRIAKTFTQLADLLEFQGANAFRIRAYRNAAHLIQELPESLAALVADPNRKLTDLPGLGKDLANKCETLIQTGELPQLTELLQQVPRTVLDLLRIPGLGPKKAALLHRELGICTLDELKAACENGQVRTLKGLGPKSETSILNGLQFVERAGHRMLWAEADQLAHTLRTYLTEGVAVDELVLAGSYRRGRDTVGDLDFLAVCQTPAELMDRLVGFPEVAEVLVRGDTKLSVRLEDGKQIDLRIVGVESFGAAWQYFTGSQQHNIDLRGRAKRLGLKVNEYGVFRIDAEANETYVAGRSEQEVYAALDLPLIPPELREGRQEIAWAEADRLPELIELDDIAGDLHMHTVASDGTESIEHMADAARARGLHYIAITDHSQRVSMANGLEADRLLLQWREIDRINRRAADDFRVLKGIECDILEAGGMDLPDDILAQADWVLASVHYGQKQSRSQITDRILGAVENPYVSAIAHPTGRLLNRRPAYDVDLEAVFAGVVRHKKCLELNANPRRLDLHDVHCAAASARGIPIVINTDAHSVSGLDVMCCGILQARRGGLTANDVLNTRPWKEIQSLLGRGT